MSEWLRPIAAFSLDKSERLFLSVDDSRNEAVFAFMDRVSISADSGRWRDVYRVPISALREIGARVADETLRAPLSLGPGYSLIVVPEPPVGAVKLLIARGGTLVRAAHLSKGGRRRLVNAIEQARAAACDPSLIEDALARLGAT